MYAGSSVFFGVVIWSCCTQSGKQPGDQALLRGLTPAAQTLERF